MKAKKCTDWLGNEFPSENALCKYHGIPRATYRYRMAQGYTQEMSASKDMSVPKGIDNVDHLGNKYTSVEDKCTHYGVREGVYRYRKKKGWGEERALTTPVRNFDEKRTDHLGNVYPSIDAMCYKYNISSYTYIRRREKGWTVEEALTIRPGSKESKEIVRRLYAGRPRTGKEGSYTDYLGNTFEYIADMCNHHGVSVHTFEYRRSRGYSNKECLTGIKESDGRPISGCFDHSGKWHRCVADMCGEYGITVDAYYKRVASGMSLEKILTTPLANKGRRRDTL